MKRRATVARFAAWLIGVGLIAAVCGDDSSKSDSKAAGATVKAVNPADIPKDSSLVIGAEQEPDCADWIASCAGSSWGAWMFQYQTMP